MPKHRGESLKEADDIYESYEATRAMALKLEERLNYAEKLEKQGIDGWWLNETGYRWLFGKGNVLIRALLQNDADLVKAARDAIASEIVLGRKEGIKDDWSFHQHGPQQQFGNYGLSFVTGMSFFFQLFKDTDYEFTGQQREILVSLIDKGYRWVIWNRYMDVSSLGRQFFHNAQIHKAYSLAFAAEDMDWQVFLRMVIR